jgi:hypothetical protein
MAATVVVTFLAIFRVDVSHGLSVSFRHAEKYQATEVLMLEHPEPPGVTPTNIPSPIATTLFAQLANSSVVRSLVLKTGPLHGSYTASSAPEPSYPAGTAVPPILSIVSEAGNSNQATLIAELVSNAFVAYMHNAWLHSTGPPSQEIEVRKISLPTHPKSHTRSWPHLPAGHLQHPDHAARHLHDQNRQNARPLAAVSSRAGCFTPRPDAQQPLARLR